MIDFNFKKPGFKKLLIFDLDHTLIHCPRDQNEDEDQEENEGSNVSVDSNGNPKEQEFFKFVPEVYIQLLDPENGDTHQTGFTVRPYAIECLKQAN